MSAARQRPLPLWAWWILVGGVHIAVFGPVAFRAEYRRDESFGPNLFEAHTTFTQFVFDDWWRPATPGYLWQVTARTATEVFRSQDLRLGATIATCLFYAVFGIALFEVFRRATLPLAPLPRVWAAALTVPVAIAESPAALNGWRAFERGEIFVPLYLPYAPTTIGSLGLNVLLLLQVSRLIEGELPRGKYWQVPVLVVAATIAKPTFSPLLVAVVVGYACLAMIRRRPDLGLESDAEGRASWNAVVRLVVLPAVVILIPQYLVTANFVQYPGTAYDDRGSWIIHPFAELRDLNGLNVFFWLIVVFPVLVFALGGRAVWRDAATRLATIAAAIGLVAAILLERADSIWKGDMLQLPATAIGLVFVFGTRRVLDLRRSEQMRTWAFVVLALVFATYVVAGLTGWSCRVGLGCPTS